MTEENKTKQPKQPKSRTRRVDRWRVELLVNSECIFFIDDVEGLGQSQFAICYSNGEVAYDYPERLSIRQRYLMQNAMQSLKKVWAK